ncbi:MAG: lipopolysaccharide biosynthesis protein [Lachnospiraceae bacterium]|nr:lipopolysaccharide biosynthesis protein [Lachnospiraceae bacterium]
MASDLKKKAISSLIWRFLERCGAQGVSFIVSIVLARLLEPEVYGTIALISVFTAILQVFVDSGMANALIQKKDADELDFSSVFFFNLTMCLALYLLLFFCAPLIASFYNNAELIPVIRVLGITLLISGVKNVQQAYVSRTMQFKRFFFATLGGTIGAAVVGIAMAYIGFGVWALVAQTLFNSMTDTVILWITVKWRPRLLFSFRRLKGLLNYGWKLLVSGLLHTIYINLRSLMIGKFYTAQDLAYYEKGQSFPSFVVTNINSSIDSVLLPTMSGVQDNRETVKAITRRSIVTSSYLMWPMMVGLAAVAKPLVLLLLTEKWLPAVPFLQITCFALGLEPLQTANLNAIKAMGRSDIFLKLEIVKKAIAITILFLFMRFGVLAIAVSGLVYSVIAAMFNSYPNRKLLGYSYFEQIRDILPSFLLALVMGAVIYLITLIPMPTVLILTVQILVGVIIYAGVSCVLKLEPFFYILNTIKQFKGRSK